VGSVRNSNLVIINKTITHPSSSGVFVMTIAALAAAALMLGYIVYNEGGSNKGGHKHKRAMAAQVGRSMMTYDVNPAQLKARIVQILVNNTMDLNTLNNVMNHVLNKIDADMQPGGLLHGMVVERSVGSIDRVRFSGKLAEYVKNMAASLSIPLMNKDHGEGSFVKRYMEGGGGSGGGYGFGTLYGRVKNTQKRASVYGMPARVTADQQIELIDNTLRRY